MVSTFETCLIRYHIIGQRLIYANFVLDKLAEKLDPAKIKTIFLSEKEGEQYGMDIQLNSLTSRICFDFLVVQLYSLLEVHDEISSHLNTLERKNLESYLEPAWNEVKKEESRICKWRNNFVAHGKSFAKDGSFIALSDVDPDYFEGQINLFCASKCAIIYIHGFLINNQEYSTAISTFRKKTGLMKTMTSGPYLAIDVNPILTKVRENLKQNKLNDDIQPSLRFI